MSKADPHKRITLENFKTYKRLDYPPKDDNFENLVDNWDHYSKRLILFLGAGASYGALNKLGNPLPQSFDLRNELYVEFLLPREKREGFKPDDLGTLSLEHVAALAEQRTDRKTIEEFVSKRFFATKPLWQHTVLPFLNPHAIFTTNYDNLIELGWKQHSLDYVKDLKVLFEETSRLSDDYVPLYKSHGSVELPHKKPGYGGIVLSMFDYFEMIPKRKEMLKQFTNDFTEYCLIFIGYSMQDMDIAQQLYEIRKDRSGRSWYAVFPRNEANVRKMYQEKFKVSQINRTFHDFMSDLDDAVNFIPEEWKFKNIRKLLDDGIIQGE
jgi:hypothetical protein